MDTVLFIPYHLESHILPTLVLTNALKERYKIVYALPKKLKWVADLHQLDYRNLESVPFGYGFEPIIRRQEGSSHVWRDAWFDRQNARISKHREKKLKEVIDTVKPRFIVLDMLSATDFILLYPWLKENNAGVAIVNPMLSTYTDNVVPRIGSTLNPANRFKTILENIVVRFMYNVFNVKEHVLWLGNGNRSLIKREFKKRSIPEKYKPVAGNYVTQFFNGIPELIIAPQELEFFPDKARRNQHYIGLLPEDKRADSNDSNELKELAATISSWKKVPGTRIIFCAFGSMHGTANMIITDFLHKLFAVKVPGYDLKIICAFADTGHLIQKEKLPDHIHLYDRLPQPQLLPLCDLFITHAGLGSLKEAIASEIPMLAYPFTKHWDSTGNAVKIEYHGLGLKGDILKDTTEMIGEKIGKVLSEPVYKNKISALKKVILSKYTKEKFLRLFETLLEQRL